RCRRRWVSLASVKNREKKTRRGGRVADRIGLENRRPARVRGFESRPLRFRFLGRAAPGTKPPDAPARALAGASGGSRASGPFFPPPRPARGRGGRIGPPR